MGNNEICTHDDCFTCPYPDCISKVEVEPERKKRGRKPLSPEERKKRKQLRSRNDYEKNKAYWRERYIEQTKDKVTHRYRSRNENLALNKSENIKAK